MIGIGISIPMMMPFAEDATAFVRPGVLRSPFTITRAQLAGVQSSEINGTDDGLTLYDADVPRFNGSAQRLLIEGQGTNGIRNPRQAGAVVNNPGTSPTHMVRSFSNGMEIGEIVSVGIENNIPYVDYRITGTVLSGFGIWALNLDASTNIPALTGQTWVGSWYWRLITNPLGGPSIWQMIWEEKNSSGVDVGNFTALVPAPTGAALGSQRILNTRTLVGGVNTAFLLPRVRLAFPVGVHDYTLRFGLPDFKLGAVPSTPILPPAGTPGASTRGDDAVNASLSSLGIAANGACTILWHGVVPVFVPSGVHTIFCIDDGSVNNRFTMQIDQTSGQLQSMRALAGASATANAGAVTANIAFKGGITLNGAGRATVSLNGGAVAAVTGGPTSSLTQFRLGKIFDASAPMFGETERLRILPYSVSDAELQSLTGALP